MSFHWLKPWITNKSKQLNSTVLSDESNMAKAPAAFSLKKKTKIIFKEMPFRNKPLLLLNKTKTSHHKILQSLKTHFTETGQITFSQKCFLNDLDFSLTSPNVSRRTCFQKVGWYIYTPWKSLPLTSNPKKTRSHSENSLAPLFSCITMRRKSVCWRAPYLFWRVFKFAYQQATFVHKVYL